MKPAVASPEGSRGHVVEDAEAEASSRRKPHRRSNRTIRMRFWSSSFLVCAYAAEKPHRRRLPEKLKLKAEENHIEEVITQSE